MGTAQRTGHFITAYVVQLCFKPRTVRANGIQSIPAEIEYAGGSSTFACRIGGVRMVLMEAAIALCGEFECMKLDRLWLTSVEQID